MIRAQEAHGSYVNIFQKYNKGHFKFASKNFYSEFLAARKIAKDLEKKIKIKSPENVSYIKLKGYVSLNTLSRHFQLSAKTIHSFNLALRPPIVKGEKRIPKGYRLRLPKTTKTQKLIARLPSSVYKTDQKATRFHRVQAGETAGSIAKRYGVSLKHLMTSNNLDGLATIFIKQKLRIPTAPTIRSTKSKKDYSNRNSPSQIPLLLADKKNRPTKQQVNFFPAKNATVYNVFNIHKKNGFRQVGFREKVGKMNEVWRDSVLMERRSQIVGVSGNTKS